MQCVRFNFTNFIIFNSFSVYLARFALAHQWYTESSDSADSQLESWSNSEGSSEEGYIKSGVPMDSDGSSEKEFLRSGVPMDSEGSNEKEFIKPKWPNDDQYGQSIMDNEVTNEKEFIKPRWPNDDQVVQSLIDSDDSSKKEFIKSGVPLDSDGHSEKVLIKLGVPMGSEGSSEKEVIGSGVSLDSDGYNEKVLIKSGLPMGSEGSREKAFIRSGAPLDNDGSSEKVLIKSGVPLRGRTIHHTAWSEEDKVQESNKNPPQQQIENGGEKFYDSWSLRKALNYILSFVYDVEDDGIVSNHAPNSPENPNDKLKLQKSEFDELMAVPQTQGNPKDKVGNLSLYNRNRDNDNTLHTTPNYFVTYFEKQDVEGSEGRDGNLNNENRYGDYEYEDNYNESLNDDIDSQYEDGFSDEPDDESATDQGQRGKLKDMESKIFKQPESDIQKTSRNEHLYKVIENEPAFETEHLHQKRRACKEVNGNILKLKKEDDIQLNEGTLDDQNSNNKIQEPRKEIKVVKIPTNHSEESSVKNQSIEKEISSNNTNQESKGNGGKIIAEKKDKPSSGTKMIHPKEQDSQIMFSETSTSSSKFQNKEPLEISEDNVADRNSVTSEANIITESKMSNEILKKNCSSPRNVSNDLQKDDNGGENSAKNSSEKTTIEGKPSNLNTTNDKKPSQIKEESVIKTINVPGSDTKGYSQPKDEKKIINTKPPTLVPQKHPQQKEQSPDSGNHARNEKSEIIDVDNNHGGKQADVHQQTTTELQYGKVLKGSPYDTRTTPENSIVYVVQKIRQQKIEGRKETVHLPEKESPKVPSMQSNLNQNVKSLKKPLKENDTKHSKPKMKMLNDKYIDLEPDENVGSYNYILDSYEFIRIDENNQNKLKNKQDNSVHILVNDEKGGAPQEKVPPILPEPLSPFIHQSEHELKDESHEVFGTILEYLYKNSNNSFLLSLKEDNSSES